VSRSPKTRTLKRSFRKALRMASPIPSFDAYLSQFYKHNLLACFIKCIVARHGWIATP
jgi:hypothetical protein